MGFTERLARACARRPKRTLAAWGFAVLVALVLVATSLHGLTSNSNVIGSPQSTKAADAIARAFPNAATAEKHDVIVVTSSRYAVTSPPFRSFLERQAAKLAATGKVSDVRTAGVSRDGHAVLVSVTIDGDSDAKQVEAIVEEANGNGFAAGITGYRSANYDFGKQSQKDLESGELSFGLPAALIVLVLVFGAVVAGLVPVMMAILSIVVALGIVALLSLAFSLSMFIVPTSIMRSLALGAILVGIVSVVAALTLLPALLSLLGDRVNALRVPFLGRNLGRTDALEGRFWRRIVETVLRRPAVFLVVTVAAILVAASPIFGLHIGANGVGTLPNSLPSKQGYLLLQREFPGQTPEPVNIVALGSSAFVRADLQTLERRLAGDPRFGAGTVQTSRAQNVSLLSVPVRGDSAGHEAVSAVRDLRKHVIPAVFAGSSTKVYVGGETAEDVDYFDAVTNPTPFVLAFVLGLSLILLTIAFRSIVVALVSIVLNLLSVGAAYGLLTLVFLKGYGAHFFGFEHTTVIDAWVPLFLFSVLFGLSMDYQVFLMIRIKERYEASGSTRDAVAHGVSSTARIITGAALIIVVVFAGFAAGKLVMFQQMGFGVAVALLIDATLIRSVVLPSMLSLLGAWSWYLPRWLDWLPHVEVERPSPQGDAATA